MNASQAVIYYSSETPEILAAEQFLRQRGFSIVKQATISPGDGSLSESSSGPGMRIVVAGQPFSSLSALYEAASSGRLPGLLTG